MTRKTHVRGRIIFQDKKDIFERLLHSVIMTRRGNAKQTNTTLWVGKIQRKINVFSSSLEWRRKNIRWISSTQSEFSSFYRCHSQQRRKTFITFYLRRNLTHLFVMGSYFSFSKYRSNFEWNSSPTLMSKQAMTHWNSRAFQRERFSNNTKIFFFLYRIV